MKLRDLVPWATGKESVPVTHDQDKDPFTALQRQVNDVINGFYRGFDMEPFGGFGAVFTPGVNVLETDT
ncbi:MAG: hypothetical protein L7F77_08340, partial [Candidatus Magnetominusculus sp. LBB02]|nr:hypothetical protein [Candidatus Magnetominusculus sp. LBB02]